jgi:ribosomal protein L11 methylase PrmA
MTIQDKESGIASNFQQLIDQKNNEIQQLRDANTQLQQRIADLENEIRRLRETRIFDFTSFASSKVWENAWKYVPIICILPMVIHGFYARK